MAYITARPEPRFEWFFDSLSLNARREEISQIIVVDFFAQECDGQTAEKVSQRIEHVMTCAKHFHKITRVVPPKPNVWQGKHRLTPRNWWAASNARNSALCLCKNDFIAYLDDRCVLAPTWLDAVLEAREKQYAVCGVYEKRSKLMVLNGRIVDEGELLASDVRMKGVTDPQRRRPCPGEWVFGCTFALPTEWMLNVNGFSELSDSASMEDVIFGKMLENNGYPIYHDGRMKMIEDRTIEECDSAGLDRAEFKNPAHNMKRSSKEKHPNDVNDKLHTLLRTEAKLKRSTHQWDLRVVRNSVLAGNSFPVPTTPTHDWHDQQALKDMT